MATKRKTKHDRQLGEWAKKANAELCKKLQETTGLLPVAVNHIGYATDTCRFSVIFLRQRGDITFYYLDNPNLCVHLCDETYLDDVVTYFTSKLIAWIHHWWQSEAHEVWYGQPCNEYTLMRSFYVKGENSVLRNLILGVKPDVSNQL